MTGNNNLTRIHTVIKCSAISVMIYAFLTTASVSVMAVHEDEIKQSVKDVRILSPEWICVVVDPTAEILAERSSIFGEELAKDYDDYINKRGNSSWFFDKSTTYRSIIAIRKYHLPLFVRLNDPAFWMVNGKKPQDVSVWAQSVDSMPAMSAKDKPATEMYSSIPRLVDMVYLKLNEPLSPGKKTIGIKTEDGRDASIQFDDESTVAWSIKVNQLVYDLNAKVKPAYLGMWIPGIGAADFSSFAGKEFYVKSFESGDGLGSGRVVGQPVYTGTIRLRKRFQDQEVKRDGGANLTGEDVYEMDFSELKTPGKYAVYIPGLGRSWPFTLSDSGYGDAFYAMMKGLFIQRSGDALALPHTAWERPACFTETRRGEYIPETDAWYRAQYRKEKPQFGFRDQAGKQIRLSPFTLIGNSPADAPIMSGVKGGWHDAADYDRRYFHYNVIWDLLALAEAFPTRFSDEQLNMPESGNGVPDIIDEAAWGIDVWKSTQRNDGAVSSWIEQESHPHAGKNLAEAFIDGDKKMPFYASIPDRTGTFAYASAAAWLGRLLAKYSPERSREYIESAEKAYRWAKCESSTMSGIEFEINKPMRDRTLAGQTIKFDEDPEIIKEDNAYKESVFAAANLYLATEDKRYLEDWNSSGIAENFSSIWWRINPVVFMPIIVNAEKFDPQQIESFRRHITKEADEYVAKQQNHPYRMFWLAPDDGWFHTMAWGNIYQKTRILPVAWISSKNDIYKTAMQNAADFFLGTNPLGSSMITGVGSVFPVVIQHIHSMVDGIAEPSPGIVPYGLTYGVSMLPFYIADAGHPSVNSFYTPDAMAFIPDKLGRKNIQQKLDQTDKSPSNMREMGKPLREIVWKNYPVLRRKAIHPTHVVNQNEFTVNETISPLALLFGTLTNDNWEPAESLKHRKPERDIDKLPYYPMP